jgi:hypothetical protein
MERFILNPHSSAIKIIQPRVIQCLSSSVMLNFSARAQNGAAAAVTPKLFCLFCGEADIAPLQMGEFGVDRSQGRELLKCVCAENVNSPNIHALI